MRTRVAALRRERIIATSIMSSSDPWIQRHGAMNPVARSLTLMGVRGLVLLTVVAVFGDAPHALAADVRVNVYVTCDGIDIVGAHLCFAVKEGIITSAGFQLVDGRTTRTGIAVHLVSVDASPAKLPKGVTSAVSVTYTFFGGPIEFYSGAQVFLVGSKKVGDIASAVLYAIETRASELNGQTASE
jgi:hypothetical protein